MKGALKVVTISSSHPWKKIISNNEYIYAKYVLMRPTESNLEIRYCYQFY